MFSVQGGVLVCYHSLRHKSLKAAFCSSNDPQCANITHSTLDSPVAPDSKANVGRWLKMALGSDGLPIIAYFDSGDPYVLKLLRCLTPSCSSSSVNVVAAEPGYYPSVTVGPDGFPLVAWYSSSMPPLQGLWVSHCLDLGCESTAQKLVFPGAAVYPSIGVISSGLPVISFYNTSNDFNLTVVHGNLAMVQCAFSPMSTNPP